MPDPTAAEFRETIRLLEAQRDAERTAKETVVGELQAERLRVTTLAAEKQAVVADLIAERGKAGTLADELRKTTAALNERNAERDALAAEVKRLKAGEPPPVKPTAGRAAIGANLETNHDYSGDACWANAFRKFTRWGKVGEPWKEEGKPPVNADGYPLADASTFSYLRGYPGGKYLLCYGGSGTPSVSGKGSKLTVTHQGDNKTSADVTFNPDDPALMAFTLKGVDPANPPSDMTLLAPGCKHGESFAPWFVSVAAKFACLRTMDWQRTNASPLKTWADRVRPEEFCQTTVRGVAHELIADLSNETGVDAWICIPDQADDDYIRQTARLFKTRLAPSRGLRVAWSNEAGWNTAKGFDQGERIKAASLIYPGLPSDPVRDPVGRLAEYVAEMNHRNVRLWREEWGDQSHRLKFVYETHAGTYYLPEKGLKYISGKYGPPVDFFHSLAVTLYYDLKPEFEAELLPEDRRKLKPKAEWDNPDRPEYTPDSYKTIPRTPEEIAAHLAERTKEDWSKSIGRFKTLANGYGMALDFYEGNQHVNNWNGLLNRTANSDAKKAFKQHPAAAAFIAGWVGAADRQFGEGATGCFYMLTGEAWGLVPTIRDTNHPKWKAFAEATK